MVITARLPPEEGAVVMDVLEKIVNLDTARVSAETPEPAPDPDNELSTAPRHVEPDNLVESSPGQRARADALVAMAERASSTLDDELVSTGTRGNVLVVLDGDAILGKAGGECHLEHGPSIAFETACRLGCEGTMAVLVRDSRGNPLHLGDTTPVVNRRQKRALLARDKGCRFPGCDARRYLHAHHIVHWVKGGKTCIPNLALLCGHHHRLVHEGGFGVAGANGRLTFTDNNGNVIPVQPTLTGDADALVADNIALDLDITADTPGSRSNGERYDKGLVSDVLWCLLHPEYILGTKRPPGNVTAA
jgi:hypothetical protein